MIIGLTFTFHKNQKVIIIITQNFSLNNYCDIISKQTTIRGNITAEE